MLQFRGQMLAAEDELTKLRELLRLHEGAFPTRKLDPSTVDPSDWANRHPDAFQTPEFQSLKQDIALSGGNVQAIAVRPQKDRPGRHEILFGHRRHRACLDLGLPVLATIVDTDMNDLDLFMAMDRENRERADLSPYEQGHMYRKALDAKLFPSNRSLADALGVSHTWVNKVLLVADLPTNILECFESPLVIQHRHAKVLSDALHADRKAVLRRAEKVRQAQPKMAASVVVAALVNAESATSEPSRRPIEANGKSCGEWERDRAGRLHIRLDPLEVSNERIEAALKALVEGLQTS